MPWRTDVRTHRVLIDTYRAARTVLKCTTRPPWASHWLTDTQRLACFSRAKVLGDLHTACAWPDVCLVIIVVVVAVVVAASAPGV